MTSVVHASNGFPCLICGVHSECPHLGVNLCRACTMFYRRTKRNGPSSLLCRTGKNLCETGRRGSCKKCRFARILQLLNQDVMKLSSSPVPPEPQPSGSYSCTASHVKIESVSPCQNEATTSKELPTTPKSRTSLDRLRTAYREFYRCRAVHELKTFHDETNDGEEFDYTPATHHLFLKGAVIFIDCLAKFASEAFDEFAEYSSDDQWKVVLNCYDSIALLETTYQSEKCFPHDIETNVCTVTTCNRAVDSEIFFEGSSTLRDKDEAKLVGDRMRAEIARCRRYLREHPIDEDEFIVIMGLQLWNSLSGPLPDRLAIDFDRLRAELLLDLHTHYREDLLLEDYAGRLGRLFALISNIKSSMNSFREYFEVYFLVGAYDENSIAYQLARA